MNKMRDVLYKKICHLRDKYNLVAIKAEFEAEGSTFRDLMILRDITRKANVKLFLKIGGTEAVRDIKDCFELDVDGIIVPMIENGFNVVKFFQAYDKIYQNEKVYLTMNIESKSALDNLDEIFECGKGRIDNITIGRTDLTDSFMNESYDVDCGVIMNKVLEASDKARKYGYSVTIGGSVSKDSITIFKTLPIKFFDKSETRKVVLSFNSMKSNGALDDIFDFESFWISYKKYINTIMIKDELLRLEELQSRLDES